MAGVTPQALLLVAIGGAAGSVLRYLTSVAAIGLFGAAFPWGTLAVNAAGSLAIGGLAATGLEGNGRILLVTGFLGGFTTFSAFSLETTVLWERAPALAIGYAAASVALGVACCLGGLWLFRR